MPDNPFTIDELAKLSDEEALRRSSDRRILNSLRWVLRIFFFISLVEILVSSSRGEILSPRQIAFINLLLVLVPLLAFHRMITPQGRLGRRLGFLEPLAGLIRRQPRGVALTYLVLQLWITMFFAFASGEVSPWIAILPQVILFFRFAPSERFAVHAIYVLSAVVGWLAPLILDLASPRFDHVMTATIANAVPLAIGLYVNRRIGRRFLDEWRDARQRAREQIRMRQELEYAREIQLGMLPRETPRLDWMDLASVSIPATEVGGDYYDFYFPCVERLVLVSADVAGHGLGSGLVLSGVRSGLALLSDELEHPELVMKRLHGMLRKTTGTRMLVTMAMLSFDRETRNARYATAGHPPMLVRRGSTGVVEEIFRTSLPLGAALGGEFTVDEFGFEAGDTFVLHTDGVYEMRNAAGEAYGLERLGAAFEAVPRDASAQEVRDAILRSVFEFRQSAVQEDDLTLVVAKVREEPSRTAV